jgi:hypothetical protein
VKNLRPGGKDRFEAEKGLAGVGIGGVLGEERENEAVEDRNLALGSLLLVRRRLKKARAPELGELLGEAVEREEGVSHGEALLRCRGRQLRVRIPGSGGLGLGLGLGIAFYFSRHLDRLDRMGRRRSLSQIMR